MSIHTNSFLAMMAAERNLNDFVNCLLKNHICNSWPWEISQAEEYLLRKFQEELEIAKRYHAHLLENRER